MNDFFEWLGLSGNEVDKAVATAIVLAVGLLLRRLILRETNKRLEDPEIIYRTRKGVTYVIAFAVLVGFIVIWVQAREEVILERLGEKKRTGHLLTDPLPLHQAFKRDFEEYDRSLIDCHNNGRAEETVADLVQLFEKVATLGSVNA